VIQEDVREWISSLASQHVFSESQATPTLILFAKCEWNVSEKKSVSELPKRKRRITRPDREKVKAFLCYKYKIGEAKPLEVFWN
jgi:hypothetical protein